MSYCTAKEIPYTVEISDGTGGYEDGSSLSVTEYDGVGFHQVMSIRKPCQMNELYMIQSKDYVVNITWRKSGNDLISLVFKMMLPTDRYQTLVAGDKKIVEEKVLSFYLQTLETLKKLEKSFPV